MKKIKFKGIFEKQPEGGYICWIVEMPEAMSQGETLQEAKANLLDAMNLILEYRREKIRKRHTKHQFKQISLAAM